MGIGCDQQKEGDSDDMSWLRDKVTEWLTVPRNGLVLVWVMFGLMIASYFSGWFAMVAGAVLTVVTLCSLK